MTSSDEHSTLAFVAVDSQAPLNILVVDDESPLRETLRQSFTREGHSVMAVADGRAAIDRATTGRFDIVLLDVALGAGPDGYEVCRTLRSRRNVVPIIMLTALDSEADAVLGLEAGADDYVTKPFGLAELRSRIRAVLRRATRARSATRCVSVGPGDARPRQPRGHAWRAGRCELTFSEFELLSALMGSPAGCSAARSCCARSGATAPTAIRAAIDVHIRHLREKLEERPEVAEPDPHRPRRGLPAELG